MPFGALFMAALGIGFAILTSSDAVLLDGLMSVAVGIAFGIAVLLQNSSFAHLLPYADPAVVIVLVILSPPIPFTIIRDNWNQLLGRAPDAELQSRARRAVEDVFESIGGVEPNLHMQVIGRFVYLQIYVVCQSDSETRVDRMDEIRGAVHGALTGTFDNLALDVVFTRNPCWAVVSVGDGVVCSEG